MTASLSRCVRARNVAGECGKIKAMTKAKPTVTTPSTIKSCIFTLVPALGQLYNLD